MVNYDIKKDFSINARVKMIRKNAKLTQSQFSNMIGIKQATLSDIERSKIGVSINLINMISKKFNIEVGWLLTGASGINKVNTDISFSVEAEHLSDRNTIATDRNTTFKDISEALNDLIYKKISVMDFFLMSILSKLEDLLNYEKHDDYSESEPVTEYFNKELAFLQQFDINLKEAKPAYFNFSIDDKLKVIREIEQANERMLARARSLLQDLEYKYYIRKASTKG